MSHLESGVAKKLLLMRKIDMSTCLHASAMNGHVLVTRHLLKIGGNELLYMRKNSGASCLYDSAEAGQDETVENSVQSSFRVRQNGGVTVQTRLDFIKKKNCHAGVTPTNVTPM